MANQRIAYGLCKKYGIKLKEGATPADAWKALKEAGHGSEAEAMSANSENDDKSVNDIANEGKEKKPSISMTKARGEYNDGKGSRFADNPKKLAKKMTAKNEVKDWDNRTIGYTEGDYTRVDEKYLDTLVDELYEEYKNDDDFDLGMLRDLVYETYDNMVHPDDETLVNEKIANKFNKPTDSEVEDAESDDETAFNFARVVDKTFKNPHELSRNMTPEEDAENEAIIDNMLAVANDFDKSSISKEYKKNFDLAREYGVQGNEEKTLKDKIEVDKTSQKGYITEPEQPTSSSNPRELADSPDNKFHNDQLNDVSDDNLDTMIKKIRDNNIHTPGAARTIINNIPGATNISDGTLKYIIDRAWDKGGNPKPVEKKKEWHFDKPDDIVQKHYEDTKKKYPGLIKTVNVDGVEYETFNDYGQTQKFARNTQTGEIKRIRNGGPQFSSQKQYEAKIRNAFGTK